MSKRVCISLLHAPQRTTPSLRQCNALRPSTVRGDTLRFRHQPRIHLPTLQKRCLSQSSIRSASANISPDRQITTRRPSAPSTAVQRSVAQKNAMASGAVFDYLGIVEGTFIPPSGKNLPSLFRDPRGRLKIEYYRFWSRIDYLKSYASAYFYVQPRLKLQRRQCPAIARELYEKMYTSFAKGDLTRVENDLGPGLLASLRRRMAQRPASTTMLWTLHQYKERPKVVSYKYAGFSGEKTQAMGVEQAVVRIRTLQSLLKMKRTRSRAGTITEVPVDSEGVEIEGHQIEAEKKRNSKETTEYLVIQRFIKKSRPGPWHIWGTTEEHTLQKVRENEKKTAEATLNMHRSKG